jgi:hypothetical protein
MIKGAKVLDNGTLRKSEEVELKTGKWCRIRDQCFKGQLSKDKNRQKKLPKDPTKFIRTKI